MNVLEAFQQRVRVESAVLVADADSLGREVCALALRRGIDELERRLGQLGFEARRPSEAPVQRVLRAVGAPAVARATAAVPTPVLTPAAPATPTGATVPHRIAVASPRGREFLASPLQPDLSGHTKRLIVERLVAEAFGISASWLAPGSAHSRRFAVPRHATMYLLWTCAGLSLPRIARLYGKMDHTTVLHGRNNTKDRASTGKLPFALDQLERRVCDELEAAERVACGADDGHAASPEVA